MSIAVKPYRELSIDGVGRGGQSTSLELPGGTVSRFYLADCLDLFRSMDAASVDVIVTSPPYNMGIRYNTYEDALDQQQYLAWTAEWVGAAARVLTPEGSLFLNVGTRPSDPWTALDVAQAARPHLRLQNIIHWVKSVAIDQQAAGAAAGLTRDLAVGHYKPINSERYLNDCHEFVFHFTPNGSTRLDRLALGVPYQDRSNITRWRAGADGVRCRGNTWFVPYETIQRRDRDRPHPATFPAKLPEQCIRLHGLSRVRTVMDPFIGLGSTAVACARLGVGFIGCDIDQLYLDEAVERMRAALVQPHAHPGLNTRVLRATQGKMAKARLTSSSTSSTSAAPGRRARSA
jgi:site-specific DNA-methyltransferase (adenine-specific)